VRGRLDLIRAVRAAGLPCGVMVAPVLPWITDADEQLDQLLGELAAAGATGVTPLVLHLRPGVKEWFMAWLGRERPDLVKRYEQLYGRGSKASPSYRRAFEERVRPLLDKHGFGAGSRHRSRASSDRSPQVVEAHQQAVVPAVVPGPEQQTLF
jgi:DNA repair photolyase